MPSLSDTFLSILLTSALRVEAIPTAAAGAEAEAQTTSAPNLPRQVIQSPDFIGWLTTSAGEKWTTWDCSPGLSFYQTSSWVNCCPTESKSCLPKTACINGDTFVYSGTAGNLTQPCTQYGPTYTTCITDFLYQSWGDESPQLWIGCNVRSWEYTFYRDRPPATEASTTTESSSSEAPITVTVAPSTTSLSAAAATTSSAGGGGGSSSKAWIAGAVIGPIAALALAGLGICLYWRKSKKATAPAPAPAAAAPPQTPGGPPGGYDPNAYPVYHPASPHPSSHPSTGTAVPMSEARTSQYTAHGSSPPDQQSFHSQPQQWQQQPVGQYPGQHAYEEGQQYQQQQGWSPQYGQPWPAQEGPKPAGEIYSSPQEGGGGAEMPATQDMKYR